MTFPYQTSLTSYVDYPSIYRNCVLIYEDRTMRELDIDYTFSRKWGHVQPVMVAERKTYPVPASIHLDWVSLTEYKTYRLFTPLDSGKIEELLLQKDDNDRPLYNYIAVGIAPYGYVAVWLKGHKKEVLAALLKGEQWHPSPEEMVVMMPGAPFEKCKKEPDVVIRDFCLMHLDYMPLVKEHINSHGGPRETFFNALMAQYWYRIVPVFKRWIADEETWQDYEEEKTDKPELDYVEVKCYDGTFDRLHDGCLQSFHAGGLPQRISLQWNMGKRQYSAFFFIKDVEEMTKLLQLISRKCMDEDWDFEVYVDPEQNRYAVYMNDEELSDHVELTEKLLDVMVFRNRLECYRSPSYSQPKGAWQW